MGDFLRSQTLIAALVLLNFKLIKVAADASCLVPLSQLYDIRFRTSGMSSQWFSKRKKELLSATLEKSTPMSTWSEVVAERVVAEVLRNPMF